MVKDFIKTLKHFQIDYVLMFRSLLGTLLLFLKYKYSVDRGGIIFLIMLSCWRGMSYVVHALLY